jgi:hypothetical protein
MTGDPPPLPDDALDHPAGAPEKKGLPVWAIVLIVVGVIGLVGLAGLAGTVAVVVPKMQDQQKRLGCMNNLSQLGQVYLVHAMGGRAAAQVHSGPGLFLAFGKDRRDIAPGNEKVFICPADTLARVPATDADRKAYGTVDLDHVPRWLCSYACRDFAKYPLGENAGHDVLAACIHHKGGAVMVFAEGDAVFMTLAELGLSKDDEKTVGPESKSPLLRQVRYGDGSVR